MIHRSCLWLRWYSLPKERQRNDHATDEVNERTGLLRHNGRPDNATAEPDHVQQATDVGAPATKRPPWPDFPDSWWFKTVINLIFIGWIIACGKAVEVKSYKTGLTKSQHCGALFLTNGSDYENFHDNEYQEQKEARAALYARGCYGQDAGTSPAGCQTFYNQSIGYEVRPGVPCPFETGACIQSHATIFFTTGLEDTSVLGMNYKDVTKFRRNTTCAALSMSEEFIEATTSDSSNDTVYHYKYGPKRDTEYTLTTTGDTFNSQFPTYHIDVYSSTPFEDVDDGWTPIRALTPPKDTFLSLLFIRTGHIRYNEDNNDLIFQATGKDIYEEPYGQLYRNPDPRARPMACIDSFEYCASNNTCWPATIEPTETNLGHVWFAMLGTTMADSIRFRLGSALLAQDLVYQYTSYKPSDRQWELEAENLFRTSLARMQFNLYDIASGAGHDLPGYAESAEECADDRLCGNYKVRVNSEEYKNFSLGAFIGTLLVPVLLYALTRKWQLWTWLRKSTGKGGSKVDQVGQIHGQCPVDWFDEERFLIIGVIMNGLGWLLCAAIALVVLPQQAESETHQTGADEESYERHPDPVEEDREGDVEESPGLFQGQAEPDTAPMNINRRTLPRRPIPN